MPSLAKEGCAHGEEQAACMPGEHIWLVSTAHRLFVFMCHKLMSSFMPEARSIIFSDFDSAVIFNCRVMIVDIRRMVGTIEKLCSSRTVHDDVLYS